MIPGSFDLIVYRGSTFGPVVLTAYNEDDVLVDLTGWTPFSKVRETRTGPIIYDLIPYISDGPGGEITIPAISDERTRSLPRGHYIYDLLLEQPGGQILGPFLAGTFEITTAVARP